MPSTPHKNFFANLKNRLNRYYNFIALKNGRLYIKPIDNFVRSRRQNKKLMNTVNFLSKARPTNSRNAAYHRLLDDEMTKFITMILNKHIIAPLYPPIRIKNNRARKN